MRTLTALLLAALFLLGSASQIGAEGRPKPYLPVTLNGRPVLFDIQPEVINDRTFVPLRAIFERLGATVTWDQESRSVTAVRGATRIVLALGRTTAQVGSEVRPLPAAPYAKGERTMIPLRFVSEAFGARVDYDPITTAITILDPDWPPRRGGEVRLALGNRPVGPLNPLINDDLYAAPVLAMLFDPLWRFNEAMEPVPALAEAWEWDSSGTRLTIYLRRGVRFHDGRELNAADVLFALKALWHPQNPLQPAGFENVLGYTEYQASAGAMVTASPLEGLRAPDEHTLVFTLREPDGSFLHRLTVPPVDRREFEPLPIAEWGAAVNGTGPFRLERHADGLYVSLGAHDGYWAGRPYLNRVLWRMITATEAAQEYRKGLLDGYQPGETVVPQSSALSYPVADFQYLGFNLRSGPLSDLRVRQAVARALDRQALAVLAGGTLMASPVAPLLRGGGGPPVPTYDPGAARRLLDEAGYPAGPDGRRQLSLRLIFPAAGHRPRQQAAEAVMQMLRSAGIPTEIIPLEFTALLDRLEDPKSFDLFLAGSVFEPVDPIPAGAWNRSGWTNPTAERLSNQVRRTVDPGARADLLRQWARIWTEELPALVLYRQQAQVMLDPRIRGALPGPQGWTWNLADWWIQE